MTKIWRNIDVDREKITRKVNMQKKEKVLPSIKNDIHCSNLGNDVVINTSGRVKVDRLDSCLDLNDSDFVVY